MNKDIFGEIEAAFNGYNDYLSIEFGFKFDTDTGALSVEKYDLENGEIVEVREFEVREQ